MLTEEQKAFLQQFRDSSLAESFYLTGGTALSAFYLQHRYSEDLDLFTQQEVPLEMALGFLRAIKDVVRTEHERKYDRRLFLLHYGNGRTMKVEFTRYPFLPLAPHIVVEGVQVDSVEDILANKLIALTDRKDFKDYVDLYFLLRTSPTSTCSEAIRIAQEKFGIKGLAHILKGRFLEDLPAPGALPMLKPYTLEELRAFFRNLGRELIAGSLTTDA